MNEREEIAERDWSTWARVRITKPYRAGSVDPYDERTFQPGDELEMLQWGRAGRPVDRSAWWSSADIDGAFIVPADHVERLQVIRESAPTFAGAALPAAKVVGMFGPGAAGWADLGILAVPGVYDFEIRASSGELLGLIERGGHGPAYGNPHPAEPVTFRAVIREDGSHHPPAVKFPPGFIPPDRHARQRRSERGGAAPGPGPPMASTPRPGARSQGRTADCAPCTSALLPHQVAGMSHARRGGTGFVTARVRCEHLRPPLRNGHAGVPE